MLAGNFAQGLPGADFRARAPRPSARFTHGSDLQPGLDLLRRAPREGEIRFQLVEHAME